METLHIVERGIVFADDDPDSQTRVACYPILARLSDGRILCIFKIGTSKDSANSTLHIVQSSDDGHNWKSLPFAPDTALHGVPGSLNVGHVIETAPNKLILFSNWVNRSDPHAPIANPITGGCLELRLVKFHSEDGGNTWSDAEEITTIPFPQPEVSGPAITLSQPGHLLLPMENQKYYDDPAPIDEKAYALLSFDYGRTWPEMAMIAHDPERKYWCNRVARLPQSSRLACLSWTFDAVTEKDLPIHLIFGTGDGRHWEKPISTGVMGQVSTLLPLDDERMVMTYVHRHAPASIRMCLSLDGGRHWDGCEELTIFSAKENAQTDRKDGDLTEYYQYMVNYTFGWTPTLRLNDGNILVVYFAGNEEATQIRLVRVVLTRAD